MKFSGKPIAFFDSAIGRLAVFSISLGHNLKLLETLGGDLASCDPVHFLKKLLLYICYPADALGEGQTKPDEIALSADDVEKLPDEQIDKIAGLYVEHEPYLYRKRASETKTAEDGKQVLSVGYGEIEHPKEDGENNAQYLHRLYVIQEKKQKEEMARFSKSILGTAQFSSRAFKSIADTFSMGNSMAKAVEAMRFPGINDSLARAIESMKSPLMGDSMSKFAESMSKLRPSESILASIHADALKAARPVEMTPVIPKIDFEGLAESAAKARWEPFEFLAEKIDDLTEVSAKSATFMVEMNKTQTAIAAEIKASGEQATNLSQRNLGLTKVIVILTVIGVILAALGVTFAWVNRGQDTQDDQALYQYADGIRSDLKIVADGLASGSRAADDRLVAVLEQMRQERAADRQIIEQLRARISELENQLKDSDRNAPPSGDK
ncbi:MAG: hypothetical protein AB7F75_02060 [Planctomycetota bacterium]